MPLNEQQRHYFRRICNELRKLPALSNVSFRRKKLNGLDGLALWYRDGRRFIYISNKLDFASSLDTLAHECSHQIIDMDDTHDELFRIMYNAMKQVIQRLYEGVLYEEKKNQIKRGDSGDTSGKSTEDCGGSCQSFG